MRISSFGGIDRIELIDVPEPELKEGEVSIRVAGAGVGRWDVKERLGLIVGEDKLPLTLGWECAGIVDGVGDGVTGIAVGDAVLAYAEDRGGYAEVTACPVEWCAKKPLTMTMVAAAALPVIGLTALQVVETELGLKAGERLLVTGAGGSTGFLAVQLAVTLGAAVSATAAAAHHARLRELGVGAVLDYRRSEFVKRLRAEVGEVDAILDTVGPATLAEALPLLRRGGRAVGIAGIPNERADTANVRAYYVKGDGDALRRLAEMVAAGRLHLPAVKTLRLEGAARAHRLIEDGTAAAKLVLLP
jgi:NADPH:quinone reductase-like Zn-dependent oxidoreductase